MRVACAYVIAALGVALCTVTGSRAQAIEDRIYADGFEGTLIASPNPNVFSPQLVGTQSGKVFETLNNPTSAAITVTTAYVSGADATDFSVTGFPLTVAANGSDALQLTFAPQLPWRAGTRNAKLTFTDAFQRARTIDLIGIGANCSGPVAACASGCTDSDGDGLNDAWEIAGGIDANNDGMFNPDDPDDVALSGSDPNIHDIYVQYDWMDYSLDQNACSQDTDCTGLGLGHAGETCGGPQVIPTASGSCRYQCNTDADCTSRVVSASRVGDRCIANTCQHTHDPEIVSPGALAWVAQSFGQHGIHLHIVRGRAQPHSLVTSLSPLGAVSDSCEGGSLGSGDAGPGKYAESLYDLRASSALDRLPAAYHYMVFGHYGGCDTPAHCQQCPVAVAGESGIAALPGGEFVVSLGSRIQDLGLGITPYTVAGTFMHELGHNLGLLHGGLDDANWKPNFLSVMNYRFQFTGIEVAESIGSSAPIACSSDAQCPTGTHCNASACTRLDYSNQMLPTGGNTPGSLDECNDRSICPTNSSSDPTLGLNETAGLGSATTDLSTFTDGACSFGVPMPTEGPVDWNGNGLAGDSDHALADTTGGADHACGTQYAQLYGHIDWEDMGGPAFEYAFQCNQLPKRGNQDGSTSPVLAHEDGIETFVRSHTLFPILSVQLRADAATRLQPSELVLTLLGAANLDVDDIELSSIRLYGAKPLRSRTEDVNTDGIPDLTLSFRRSELNESTRARPLRLTGWIKSGQQFVGDLTW